MTRTFTMTVAIGALLLALPGRADAQRVQIDVTATSDLGRELRDVIREVTKGLTEGLGGLSALANDGGAWSQGNSRNWSRQVDDRQTRMLAIGAAGAIEIKNLSGNVKVTAGSGRDATVEIVRHARGRTDADARLGLERVKADIQVSGSRAVIRADYANERQSTYSVSIDMIISAPVGTRVSINSVSGDIAVSGVKGELSVKTISGDVTLTNVGTVLDAKTASGSVTITGAAGDSALEVEAISGDLTLKQVKARSIKASTVSGNISASDISCETATFNALSGDASFAGDLAKNGRYEITSHSGDVHFTPTGPLGYSLSASSFGGDIHPPAGFQPDATASKRRRTVSGKVGDGSATVNLQTFSGDITIGARK